MKYATVGDVCKTIRVGCIYTQDKKISRVYLALPGNCLLIFVNREPKIVKIHPGMKLRKIAYNWDLRDLREKWGISLEELEIISQRFFRLESVLIR